MFLDIDKKPSYKTAMIDDSGKELTYGELFQLAEEFAQKLPHRSLIFVLCSNCIGAVAGYVALLQNHHVSLLLQDDMDYGLFSEFMELYSPSYLWTPSEKCKDFNEMDVVYKKFGYCLMKTGKPQCEMHNELSLLLTTSGTTGSPKLVRHSYENLETGTRNVAAFFGYKSDDCTIAELPMHYTMGLSAINSHLYSGASVILTNYHMMSREFWDLFGRYRITDFTGVPYSYEIMDKLHFFEKEYPDIRILAQGGGRLSDRLFQKTAEYAEKYGKQFFATFGTTETTARIAYLAPGLAAVKTGSIGKAIQCGEMYLLDGNGDEIQNIEAIGELGYRGPNVTMGYAVKQEDLILPDMRKGSYVTGDIARRDKDGYYYIVGRKSRFLKLYGHRVSLEQCERLISTEFHIECACTGSDDKLHVFVTDDMEPWNIVDFISKKIKIYPGSFQVHKLSVLPRSASGKIQYALLRFDG